MKTLGRVEMHDIGRTLLEPEMDEYEAEDYADDEYEYEYDDDELEAEADDDFEFEWEFEGADDYEQVFDGAEEMELAAELLSASDDEELDYFLGRLVRRARQKIKKALKGRTGRILKGTLRRVAKRALPMAGRAVGTVFGGPAGGAIGSKVGSAAGSVFGLELEGLSAEDQEFEAAKRVVRLAGDATKKAAIAQTKMPAAVAVKAAVKAAAKKHAPGLLRPMPMPRIVGSPGGRRSGRWLRRGSRIVLIGV